jgi:predicted enzyme related to lactoylglutathione lyase
MAWSHGKFYWNELMTRDPDRAKAFYAETLGWTFEAMSPSDGPTYWVAKINGEMVGGLFDIRGHEFDPVRESWMSYIAVDDVDARVAKAVKAGANIMKPAFEVPGVGRIAILLEPGGAAIGWMTPSSQ